MTTKQNTRTICAALCWAAAAIMVALATPALALITPPQQEPSVNETFGSFGFTMETSIYNDSCLVTGTTDKQTFLQRIPDLQAVGLLNSDLTGTDINTKPTMLSLAFTIQMTTVATKETFEKNPSVNTCSFIMNLKEADVYGQPASTKMLSYTFNRATFDKIDWLRFAPQNMAQVAQKFSINPAISARVSAEGY